MIKTPARKSARPAQRKSAAAPARSGEGALSDLAYSQLEEMISTLQLAPGQALSEPYLSATLGIGRTPVREALQRLARERLVVIHPRRGIAIADVNVRNQLKLLELRRELERLIARAAARRGSPEERKEMLEIADNMERAAKKNDDTLFLRFDRRFNVLSTEMARNEFLSDAIQPLQGLSRRFWYMHYKLAADMPLTAKLHADVARAIGEGNEKAAMQASDALIDYIENFTKLTISVDS
ncbi:MAG TPA: GntR family transcriptional regulator [Burkholderiaceae bacterium]|nr:GntR family transcriptional regulator [Burkholderiaceae bacterium]